MHLAPRVTIRDLPPSAALEQHIGEKLDKIDKFCSEIMHFDVVVEQAQKNKNNGKLYNTRLAISVPGEDFAINNAVNEDVYVSVRDAFDAATRKLQTYMRRRRREVKHHDIPIHGQIARIFPEDRFGFIESNGTDYYFSDANVVHPSFDELDIGMDVQFIEEFAAEGQQAKRVTTGKHHGVEKL